MIGIGLRARVALNSWLNQKPVVRKHNTHMRGGGATRQGVCAVNSPLWPQFSSYGHVLPPFPSPAETLCRLEGQHVTARGTGGAMETAEQRAIHAVVIFKTARSGSTWFHDVVSRLISATQLRTVNHWEPFCSPTCLVKSQQADG